MAYFFIFYLLGTTFFIDRTWSITVAGFNVKYFDIALLIAFFIFLIIKMMNTSNNKTAGLNLTKYVVLFFTVIIFTSLVNILKRDIEIKTFIIELGYLWPILVYVIFYHAVRREKEMRFFFFLFISFSIISAPYYYFFKSVPDKYAIEGMDYQTFRYVFNFLALPLLPVFSVVFLNKYKVKPIYWLLLIVSTVSISLGLQKTQMIVSVIGLLLIIYIATKDDVLKLRRLKIYFIFTAIIISSVFIILSGSEFLYKFHAALSDIKGLSFSLSKDQSGSSLHRRLEIIQYGKYFLESPVIGVGLGYEPEIYYLTMMRVLKTGFIHSSFFWLLTKTGVLGTIAFILFCYSFFRLSYKIYKNNNKMWMKSFLLGGTIFVFSMILSTITQPILEYKDSTALIGCWMGTILAVGKKGSQIDNQK